MTKQQKKAVRKALRQYGKALETANGPAGDAAPRGRSPLRAWAKVISQTMDYYARADQTCADLLKPRYLDGRSEWDVIGLLHIGRTTYYHKELEALSTVAVYAAAAGLI